MIQLRALKKFPAGPDATGFSLDVEFEAGPGVTVLFGQSGSGKTLTLDCIAGVNSPDAGRILLNDRILFDSGAAVNLPQRVRHCGYVFQNYALFPHMTMRQNLAFAANTLPRLERHRRVAELLERFRLTELAGRFPKELSGGQKQRASIARALITKPEVLLLDEPARGLDQALREELYTAIQEVRTLKVPVLLVTHGVEELFTLADRVLVYEAGRILQRGTPSELLKSPASESVARSLGDCNFVNAEVITLDPGRQISTVRLLGVEFQGPHLPGCFKGDRIRFCIRPEELKLHGTSGQNRLPVTTRTTAERQQGIRVTCHQAASAETLLVDLPRSAWNELAEAEVLSVEIPAGSMRRI